MDANNLRIYIDMFRRFLDGNISVSEFESTYLDFFKNGDKTLWEEPIFNVLDRIFFALDEYSHDPSLRNEGDIDEEGLREEVQVALKKLRSLGY